MSGFMPEDIDEDADEFFSPAIEKNDKLDLYRLDDNKSFITARRCIDNILEERPLQEGEIPVVIRHGSYDPIRDKLEIIEIWQQEFDS